jgi:AcrR family transcriptional regulator
MRPDVRRRKQNMLVDAACRLFSDQGYNETSVEMITAQLGSTKAVFYYQFADKHAILEAIFDRAIKAVDDLAQEALDSTAPADETLAALAHSYTKWVIDNQVLVGVIWREVSRLTPESRRRMAVRQKHIRDKVTELIRRGREQGVFDVEDDLATSLSILGSISFMHTWWRKGKKMDREAAAKQFAKTALRIAGVRGA